MQTKLSCNRIGYAYCGATMSVCKFRKSDANWTAQPTWRHYSIGLVSPVTKQQGKWMFWPLRFGALHSWRRFHLYLGVIYINFDTTRKGPHDKIKPYKAGPLSLVWQL